MDFDVGVSGLEVVGAQESLSVAQGASGGSDVCRLIEWVRSCTTPTTPTTPMSTVSPNE